MAAVLGRTELGIKEIGTSVTVPSHPKARLMYYLNCMCSVLDLSDQSNLSRLRNYSRYNSLTEAETDALIALCFLLNPKEMVGKVIFPDNAMCGDSSNKFFEISAVRKNLLVSESIIIGGQQRHVTKIMAFKLNWMDKNWIEPMKFYADRLLRLADGQPSARPAISYDATPAQSQTRPSLAAGQLRSSPAVRYEVTPAQSQTHLSANSSNDCCCIIL